MAANNGKDQPPAYTSQDHQASMTGNNARPSATPTRNPNHSTRASELLRATTEGTYTTSQYLELTFSVRIDYHNISEPVVLAIDEDYEMLLHDFQTIFIGPGRNRLIQMRAIRETADGKGALSHYDWKAIMNTGNITAMLRLLKSRNGKDYIEVF